ncbi:MAG: hypothetical protein MJZ34_11370 [Paludibacteraceae bacterium]|nr:hypothetical protein [Paludibacteraceae bacterium]
MSDFSNFLVQQKQDEYKALFDFAVQSLLFTTKLNLWHWMATTKSAHETLYEIYDEVRVFADTLAETAMAYTPISVNSTMLQINDVQYNHDDVCLKIEDYLNQANTVAQSFVSNRAVSAVFDDLLKSVTQKLAILKNYET